MIPISQIHGDLEPYHSHKVILCGTGEVGSTILKLLQAHGVSPFAFYSEDSTVKNKENFPVLSWNQLKEVLETEANSILLQFSFDELKQEEEMLQKLEKFPYSTLITGEEAWQILSFFGELEKNKGIDIQNLQHEKVQQVQIIKETVKLSQHSIQHLGEPLLLLCMPPKTGDHTFIQTFQKLEIPHHFVFHCPEAISLPLLLGEHPKIKIITAVRDPIAENISLLYQIMGSINQSLTARFLLYGHYGIEFFQQGGDVQQFFDLFVQGIFNPELCGTHPIQRFLPQFNQSILNLYDFPFSKEEGYGICKKGNVEVFVFQLEQLNQLLPQLSQFVGKEINELTLENQTLQKWVGHSYPQALKELRFSLSYFEICYEEPWVKHFYSNEQIESFKNRWKSQIL